MARPSKQVRELVGELGRAMQAYQRSTQAYDDTVGRRLGLNPADLRCLDWLVDGAKSAGELSHRAHAVVNGGIITPRGRGG